MESGRREWNRKAFSRRRRALRLSMRKIRDELGELVELARADGEEGPHVPALSHLYRQLDAKGCRGPIDRRLAPYLATILNVKESELWSK